MIGRAASGNNHGAEPGGLHRRGGNLGDDDGADDVDSVSRLQMGEVELNS